jgi:hypothetical protein
MRLKPLAVLGGAILVVLACARPSPPAGLTHDEYQAAKRTFRKAEQLVLSRHDNPSEEHISNLVEVLEVLGRESEATALAAFAGEYFADVDTYSPDTIPSKRVCVGRQYAAGLIREWANWGHLRRKGRFRIGVIAATYEIGLDREIRIRKVIRAKHPAAAWLIIDAIGNARISKAKFRRLSRDEPEIFPVNLCAWWDYDELKDFLPGRNGIRGYSLRRGILRMPSAA